MNESIEKRRKLRRLRKLKNAHIWPSLLSLLMSVLLAIAGFGFFSGVESLHMAYERLDTECANVRNIAGMLEAEGGDYAEVLDYLRNKTDFSEAIYILDENMNVTAGFGEQTYDLEKFMDNRAIFRECTIYSDYNADYDVFGATNGLDIGVELLKRSRRSTNFDVFDRSRPLMELPFWAGTTLENGDTAIVRCPVRFYLLDTFIACMVGCMSALMMFIPVGFLFRSVVNNFRNQRHMTELLYTDVVTSGKNWLYFEQMAGRELSARRNVSKLMLVAEIYVVKYGSYCNYHGAQAGEMLLENVNKYICSCLGKREYCVHSGKSSFAVMLRCDDGEASVERVRSMLDKLSEYYGHGGITFHAGVYFSENERSKDGKKTLNVRNADPADCYNRASAARSAITDDNHTALAVYDDEMRKQQMWEHRVEERMEEALRNEEFKVYVQPKYDPVTEKLAGAEALIRWINDEDGFVPPGKFIPIFEKNGFITKIDDYMLSHVAKLQAGWLAEGKKIVPVSVNVSRAHFANPDLAEHICELVDKYNVPHEYIEIELTESAFFDDKAALLRTVHQLGEKGFEISMDDFGAGYSSLNSLKDLPLDVLKLDADFFRGEDEENRGEIVVSEAITLAKKLNMRIVAEGIEKKEQVDFLAGQGCDMIQGYYFAKPMPADEYAQRLEGRVKLDMGGTENVPVPQPAE